MESLPVAGTINHKHITMELPKQSSSLYYNYKVFNSLVLLAIRDGNYCFTHVDIGQSRSGNGSVVLKNSQIGKGFENGTFNIPSPSKIPGIKEDLPFFLVGDKILPLKSWLQR